MSTPEAHDYVCAPKAGPARPSVPYRALRAAASLRLTVVLFALSMVLVFFGTLAQQHASIETVVNDYFRSWFVMIELRLVTDFLKVFFVPDLKSDLPGKVPFPGGYAIGWVMFFNLLAAHAIRFKLTWKRSGIFLLHAGVIVLLLGEFLTGILSVESRMMIREKESTSFAFHLNQHELAVIDPSDPGHDTVVVVPGSLIRDAADGQWISHPDLPFDVRRDQYVVNARVRKLEPGEESPATKGLGVGRGIQSLPRSKGTDADGRVDYPAAVLTLRDKAGAELGTYLLPTIFEGRLQPVEAGGKKYDVTFRFKRTYKPYSVYVESAEHKKYAGTETPKDYASTVILDDPEYGKVGPIRIWMNHPLRHRNETFYQSSMSTDDETGVKLTGLQVVENPAWTAPYLACILVSLGMLVHFGIKLLTFLDRRGAK
jgi:hypothetical protein